MKKIIYYINILTLIFIMSFIESCQKILLNAVPESSLTDANAFNTAKGIDLAVLGGYNALQSMASTNYELMEMPSGDMYGELFLNPPGVSQIALLTTDADNPRINSFWKSCYNGIFRANTVLDKIDIPADYSGSQKAQLTGEAKFLRACFYFDLVRIFGGVPIITKVLSIDESKKIGRSTEQEVYGQIVSDLTDAVNSLPAPSQIAWGRASKGAAVALLAKVYVYMEDWNNAKTYLDELFSSEFSYSLVANYGDLFQIATEKNSEVIYSIPFVEGTNGSALATAFAPVQGIYGIVSYGGANSFGTPAWNLRKEFLDGDTRFPVTITEYFRPFTSQPSDPPKWYPYFSKYIVPSLQFSSGLDVPLIRLADMILLNAETLYNLNKPVLALAALNMVRERAFKGPSHNYILSDISSKETFYDKLLLERRLELSAENNRWFDLVRTDRFVAELGNGFPGSYSSPSGDNQVIIPLHAKPYNSVFPIPNEQIQLANPGVLTQNEGYN